MLKVFSVYDSKADAYLQPFFVVNRAVAIRSFSSAAVDPASNFFRHPADFQLVELGEWDPSLGALVPSEKKVFLGSALEFAAASGDE